MEDTLLYFAMKYDGNFKKMLYALQTKEQTDPQKLEEYKKDVRHKYVTLVSNNYLDYFKTVECPPIVLFYKGNLKLIDEGLPMEYSVLESGKRFISTVYPIKQKEKVVFDYIVATECQDDLDKILEHIKSKGIPLKDYDNPHYSFRLINKASEVVHIFESPIDLMSFQTLEKQKGRQWNHENYLSLAGASIIGKDIEESELPLALEHFLMNNNQIKEIVLHLDNDRAGYETSEKIKHHLCERYEITDRSPKNYKDMNDILKNSIMMKKEVMIR